MIYRYRAIIIFTTIALLGFFESRSQPLLRVFIDRNEFDQSFCDRLEKDISRDFRLKLEMVRVDTVRSSQLTQGVINASLLSANGIAKEKDVFYLFLTDRKLFFEGQDSVEVRGLSNARQSMGIISSHRIKKESRELSLPYEYQVFKTVKHEFLHLLGLEHCNNSTKCMMVSSYPQTNFYYSLDKICQACFNKVPSNLLNQSIMIH